MAKAKKKTASKGKAKPAAKKKPAKKVVAKAKAAVKKVVAKAKAAVKKAAPKKKPAAKKPAAKKPAPTPVEENMIAHEESATDSGWVDENVAPPVEHMPEQEEPHDEQMLD